MTDQDDCPVGCDCHDEEPRDEADPGAYPGPDPDCECWDFHDATEVPAITTVELPERDYHQEYKDNLAQGLINEDGSQRDPDPPDEEMENAR